MKVKKILGIDFGVTKYGLCVGDSESLIVITLNYLKAKNGVVPSYQIDSIIKAYAITDIVIGLPLDVYRRLSSWCIVIYSLRISILSRHPYCHIHFQSETYSSIEASIRFDEELEKRLVHRSRRKVILSKRKQIDSLSACIIVQDWLDDRSNIDSNKNSKNDEHFNN